MTSSRFIRYSCGLALLGTLLLSLYLMREEAPAPATHSVSCPRQTCSDLSELLWGTLAAFSETFESEPSYGKHLPRSQ
jgi:hypothetical protein